MASAGVLLRKLMKTSSKTPVKVRGRFSSGDVAFSFIGSVAVATPLSLDIWGDEWSLKIDLTDVPADDVFEAPIDDGLPLETTVVLPSGATLYLTEFTK